MNDTKTYDVAIIGSGPGGYVAAIRAAQLGLSVLLVEKDSRLGGVCTLRGCIPTKALLHTADLLEETRHGAEVGVSTREVRLELAAAMKHKEKVVRQSSNGITFLMKKNDVKVVNGFGRIAGTGKVSVAGSDGSETLYSARNLLIATGSTPRSLPGIEIDHQTILSSDSILEVTEIPKSLLVVGSGAVGVELASMFARFGSKTVVVEILPRVVPIEDEEISRELAASFKRQGIAVYVDTRIEKVTKAEGCLEVIARSSGGKTESFRTEKILMAVGRKPLSEGIGLEGAGVETEKGYIRVDGAMRTNVPGIYAIGDVISGPMLAHKAQEEGMACAEFIVTGHSHVNYEAIPAVVYTHPEIASVGKTEDELKAARVEYRKGSFPFSANGRAHALGQIEGRVKVLADAKTDRLLGVHVIGPRAGDVIAEAAAALNFAASSEDLARTCHAHPTLAEALGQAALAVDQRALHI